MNDEEKAKLILEALDRNGIQIDWNMEKYYINGIVEGLKDIQKNDPRQRVANECLKN